MTVNDLYEDQAVSPSSPTTVATGPTSGRGTSTPTTGSAKFIVLFAAACGGACRAFAALLAAVWLTGAEGPSAVVDSANLVGRVVASRFDGTNDYTTVYFTHDLDRAPSAAVCYCAKGATNAVYGVWQGGWTNKVAIGGIQGDEYEGVEYLSSTGNKEKILWSGSVYGYERIEIMAKANAVPTANGYFYGGLAPWMGCYRNGGGNYACQYGSSNPNYNLGITFDTKENLIIQDNSIGSLTLTGRVTKAYSAISTSNASRSIALFGPTWTEDLNCRIFYFKHFIDGELNIHFVPVLHEGEGKMLDLVHNTLYANAGTGAFTVGPSKGKIVVPTGGWGQDVPEDPYQTAGWTDCRVLVTRRPVALRSAQARPDLRFSFGNAETRTPFAIKGITLTVNSNAVHMVDGILTKKGL